MAPSAIAAQPLSAKAKRPIPPGIQTNGINSSTSSPSPSMSAGRLPSAAKNPLNSASSNGIAGNNSGARPANRLRRDGPPQLLGRGQRNSSVGLRSASFAEDHMRRFDEPLPCVITDEYILKKYRGHPPSLVIHLHPGHFRFEAEGSNFKYLSPMGHALMPHLKSRTIPHDLIEFFTEADVPFYDGRMIVQIYDHKSIAPQQGKEGAAKFDNSVGKSKPFSVHNSNACLTPSSYVPYPTQNSGTRKGKEGEAGAKGKTGDQKDKENMPAPILPQDAQGNKITTSDKKPIIITTVLHPTPLSTHVENVLKFADIRANADVKDLRQDINAPLSATVPPTPTLGVPSTPQTNMAPPTKRVRKSKGDGSNQGMHDFEHEVVLATAPLLILEPVGSASECSALLKALADPLHAERPPAPKTRKRTVAEMAADEAQAAQTERYLLSTDDRSGISGGANPIDGNGQVGGASFEPRFERFKAIEKIKSQQEERERNEKLRREETERKQKLDNERNKLRDEAEKQQQEKARNAALQNAQTQQQLQMQAAQQVQRRAALAQQAAQQAQQGIQGVPNQGSAAHGHPQATGNVPNGISSQPQRFQQQQGTQPSASSPIVRNGTPQNHSSPIVNNIGNGMQHSTSSMGGSPARPASVVHQSHPQIGGQGSHAMAAQRSQQSHAGTPRMPSSTPNIQSTPLSRQVSATPRMSQGSPLQAAMGQSMPMPMMNGQPAPMNAQMYAQQQQMMQQRQMQQILNQQMAAGMVPNQQQAMMMAQAQANQAQVQAQQALRARMAAAQQQQQHNGQGMANAASNYAQLAMMQSNGGIPANMRQNFPNGQPTMQQMQHMQQMQQMRAQQQAAVQQQQNQQQQPGGPRMNIPPQDQAPIQQSIVRTANALYQQQRQNLINSFNGNIPPEADQRFRAQCQARAQAQVLANYHRSRAQMAAQQGGISQNMNGMQNGMEGM